uniref:MAGE domain-containing protein n=1 Tax=Globodera pallida TaxID=36090 RepID=A0A183CJW0_GLOPA
MQSSVQLRKKPKIEPGLNSTQASASNESHCSSRHNNTAGTVNESALVKSLSQCILANVSKRGFVRDLDIGEMFVDRNEREIKENVMKKTEKLLMNVLGYRLDRDEEGKRYYISTNLCKGTGLAQKKIEAQRELNEFGDGDEDFKAEENERYKNCLLEMALMFIFMSKRHSGSKTEAEKGVDQMLLRSFLDELFDVFEKRTLSSKQFGELFGPAKSAEFIAHGWLRCDIHRDQATGTEEVLYHWGPRSETVISKKKILEAFCDIYGTNPNNWPNHARVAGLRGK